MSFISISTDQLENLNQACKSYLDGFNSFHSRILRLLDDVQSLPTEVDLDPSIQSLIKTQERIRAVVDSISLNFTNLTAGVSDFQTDTNKSNGKLRDQIQLLEGSLRTTYASLGGLPVSLVAPDSAAQKQSALAGVSPAGGEGLAVSRVPASEKGGEAPTFSDYTVRPGDSLSGIAQRHGLDLQQVMASNPQIHDPSLIMPGQVLHLEGLHDIASSETVAFSHQAHTIDPQAQHMGASCGQTSVAMSITSLTGKPMDDYAINEKYGFGLLNALNTECEPSGYHWSDGGNVGSDSWGLIEQKVNQEGSPVIVALNGPEFSCTGRGHIVTITKVDGDIVYFADPATGTIRTTTKENMNNAPSHPDGNFIFYPSKVG
ncbi:LysM peptidoglycan-binding domain-containing protein [bacterium]|nr:LysM peptidoglycan-binding domain-containing protein [bacterium]